MELKKVLKRRQLRKNRIRKRVYGTPDRPRLCVYISNRHIEAQVIDDSTGKTLFGVSTYGSGIRQGTMTEKASVLARELAKKAKKAKVTKLSLDRNGRLYAKRLKALADTLREEGMEL